VVPIGLVGATTSLYLLYLHVESVLPNRLQYQSWIPWFIGVMLALTLGWRPMARSTSTPSRLIVRSLVFTLLLAPIPYGPEGTLVPAFLAMMFPPLIMPVVYPVGPLLTFVCVLAIAASWESMMSREQKNAEPVAPHEPPPRVSVSDASDNRTLDSLPAPGSSGGR
jgi:hypothetical protein